MLASIPYFFPPSARCLQMLDGRGSQPGMERRGCFVCAACRMVVSASFVLFRESYSLMGIVCLTRLNVWSGGDLSG